jgi:hypothetical protein
MSPSIHSNKLCLRISVAPSPAPMLLAHLLSHTSRVGQGAHVGNQLCTHKVKSQYSIEGVVVCGNERVFAEIPPGVSLFSLSADLVLTLTSSQPGPSSTHRTLIYNCTSAVGIELRLFKRFAWPIPAAHHEYLHPLDPPGLCHHHPCLQTSSPTPKSCAPLVTLT